MIVDGPPGRSSQATPTTALARLATLPCIVVSRTPSDLADVVVDTDDELADVLRTCDASPIAAAALALHLRATERRRSGDGLVAESTLYSTLQAGPEHRTWLAERDVRTRAHPPGAVRVERDGSTLAITLDRPAARNAVSTEVRDALVEALTVAEADASLSVHLRGEGPDFCSGGDLEEFGSTPDPATAHMVRLTRSPAAALLRIGDRLTAHLHGATIGAGIEMAAFASTVTAAEDLRVSLPELAMGLVPGAGGTVSLPPRIGRQRTAWLAFTGRSIDATTARAWGLVDHVRSART